MKRSRIVLMVLLVVFALPVALYAQETDPAAVINAANDAWISGDVEALKALYADDATVSFPDWGDVLSGREEIDADLPFMAAGHRDLLPVGAPGRRPATLPRIRRDALLIAVREPPDVGSIVPDEQDRFPVRGPSPLSPLHNPLRLRPVPVHHPDFREPAPQSRIHDP